LGDPQNSLSIPCLGKQHTPAVYAGFGVRAEDLFSFSLFSPPPRIHAPRLDGSVDPNRARSAADLKQRAAAIHGALNVILLHRALHGDRMMDLHTP